MHPDQIFATVVTVLAACAVVGGLVLVIVAEVVTIRAKLTSYRQSPEAMNERFWQGRAAVVPQGSRRKW
jgi:hypothetical protein